ncbi:hypothetical protein [Hyalangium rubrum]|uniref:Thiazolylpeptide-type bacteriocin n=1 Tax=Hyalangium rubrum TaxID=3103134 RepID=A0ABU5HI35_9BACT|nr:hypothetical protein [Hyalangium sp. s54d21]MDY7233138.1 hypothetical protein [Hyalangium sp. s54d21]
MNEQVQSIEVEAAVQASAFSIEKVSEFEEEASAPASACCCCCSSNKPA